MPPIGDMAWAASPIASSPGRCQVVSRSTLTRQQMQVGDVVELGEVDFRRRGGDFLADRVDPPRLILLGGMPLGMRNAHCQ